MTRFQQRAMAIIIHAFYDELGDKSKNAAINKRIVTVSSDSNEKLADYEIRILSRDEIEFVDLYTKFKFYSESMGDIMKFRSQDEQYMTIEIRDADRSAVRGKDGRDHRFEGRVEGYRKVKITDDEHGKDIIYLLSW